MLEVRDLVCRYGKVTALKGVSLEGARNSNSSRSSAPTALANRRCCSAISGSRPSPREQIVFEGRDITGLPPRSDSGAWHRALPGGPARLSAHDRDRKSRDGLLSARRRRTASPRTCARIFALFPRLPNAASRSPGTLSGGEQQMLAIGARPDVAAQTDHVRRTLARPRARISSSRRFAIIRKHPRLGNDGADGRAERITLRSKCATTPISSRSARCRWKAQATSSSTIPMFARPILAPAWRIERRRRPREAAQREHCLMVLNIV